MTASQKQRGERHALLSLAIMMEWPIRIAGVLSSLLIFVSFCLMIFAIFQRYFLNKPLKWGDEMLGYLLVAIVMSGMAEALRRGDHVAIDLLTSFFGKKVRAWLTHLSY
ncbi:MAG: TRAP transporter small permease, partial [Alphaproteobacteria bacterium]